MAVWAAGEVDARSRAGDHSGSGAGAAGRSIRCSVFGRCGVAGIVNESFQLLLALKDYGMAAKAYLGANYQWLPGIVVGTFTLVNSVRLLAYVPQMLSAARDANGASGISYATWSLFCISHLSTIAYALVSLGDLIMALLFFGNALACLAIIAITYVKRKRHCRHRAGHGKPGAGVGIAEVYDLSRCSEGAARP